MNKVQRAIREIIIGLRLYIRLLYVIGVKDVRTRLNMFITKRTFDNFLWHFAQLLIFFVLGFVGGQVWHTKGIFSALGTVVLLYYCFVNGQVIGCLILMLLSDAQRDR